MRSGPTPRRRALPEDAKRITRQRREASARDRLGLPVGKQARHELLRRLHRGDIKYARRLTHSRTVIVLECSDGEIALVYSSTSKQILSFLAPNAPEIAGWRSEQAAALRGEAEAGC